MNGLETALHIFPTFGANFQAIYHPANGGAIGFPAMINFANPMEFVCSAIQAGSRLGYQDSAELCAQYLAPILDAIKFNYLPFGVLPGHTAALLPKMVAYSEERLRPPPGYKDTTVPGIFSPDTPFSHGNYEPGWIAAPGMQGTQVQPATANLLTPESLGELMGGPDVAPPAAGPDHGRTAGCLQRAQPPAAAVVPATGTATASRTGRDSGSGAGRLTAGRAGPMKRRGERSERDGLDPPQGAGRAWPCWWSLSC